MSEWSESKLRAMEELSALSDGEADGAAAARACSHWADDADARSTWHAYQLIGDVLRSDDLASASSRDQQFLLALRARLAEEPVVLAPQPVVEPVRSRRSWAAPAAAVAAGFVAVAGVMVATQMPGWSSRGGAEVALNAGASAPQEIVLTGTHDVARASVVPVVNEQALDPQAVVLDGRLIRDVRLDEYLAAHKRFGGSTAPGVPSGFLRNAAVEGAR